MQNLAGQLKQWVEGSGVVPGPGLTESKFLLLQMHNSRSLEIKWMQCDIFSNE